MALQRSRLAATILGLAACAALGWAAGQRQASPAAGDLADLALARSADSAAGWEDYRSSHPRGIALAEAEAALARLAARLPVEVPAAEDPQLIARLEGRLEQIREAVAKRENPSPPAAVPAVGRPDPEAEAGRVGDPRMIEPAAALPPGRGIDADPLDVANLLRWTPDGMIHGSNDGGRTWTVRRAATGGWDLERRALRPEAQPRIALIPAIGGTPALGLLSRDAGATWDPLPAPWGGDQPVERSAAQPAILTPDGLLVAAQRDGAGVVLWTSRDLGGSWSREPAQDGFHTLAPLGGGGCLALFDAGDGQLARSTDLGRTRAPLINSRDGFATRPAAWDAHAQGVMLHDPLHRGVLTIFDRKGQPTYSQMPAYPDVWDLQDRLLLRAFAVDPRDPKHWFAASPDLGLLRSDDGGRGWRACRIERSVSAIAIRRIAGRTILAATGRTTLVIDVSAPVGDLFTVDPAKIAERAP